MKKKSIINGGIGLVCLVCAMAAWAVIGDMSPPSDTFTLVRTGGQYSLEADGADIRAVLQAVAEKSGVRIEVDPALTATVTASIQGVALDALLKQVCGSYAMQYEHVPGAANTLEAVYVTAQDPQPFAAAGADDPEEKLARLLGLDPHAERSADEDEMLRQKGLLTNSKKPLSLLTARTSQAIIFQNAIIDTKVLLETGATVDIPNELKAADNTQNYIVQFARPVLDSDREALAQAGAVICHYVPNFAYAVQVAPEKLDAIRAIAGVYYIEPYHPYFKVSPEVLAQVLELPGAPKSAEQVFNVMAFPGNAMRGQIEKSGAQVLAAESVGGREILTIQAPEAAALVSIVKDDAVQWIESRVPRQAMNDLGKKKTRANALKAWRPDLNLTGEGVVVAVTDTGVDFTNPGFALQQGQATSTNLNTRIKFYTYRSGTYTEGLPGDAHGHGTHVSGSILGNGALSETVMKAPGSGTNVGPYATNYFAGMAPAAKLVMVEDFNSFTDEEQAQIAYTNGARISNNSWGNSYYEYGTTSYKWDNLVRDADPNESGNQELIAFFAAGNAGNGVDDGSGGTPRTIGEPGNAKNVITVGALEQPRYADNLVNIAHVNSTGGTARLQNSIQDTDSNWQVAWFSSRGPATASDKRVKPDIMAPGVYVLSIQSHETHPDDYMGEPPILNDDYRFGNVNSGTNFAFFSGTSMATPLSAGGGALVYQYYTNAYGKAPSPAMMKAMLVCGARVVNSLVYKKPMHPSLVEQVDAGWGALDVERAVAGPGIQSSDEVILMDQDSALITGEYYSRQLVVGQNDGGVKIALVWTDKPGVPGPGVQLVNNLDLQVFAPGGGGYVGNLFNDDGVTSYRLDGINSAYCDAFNNVETIVIPPGKAGTYTIRVHGYQVAQGPQDFALVIMKGVGIEGRMSGNAPSLALDSSDNPVLVYSANRYAGDSVVTNMSVFLRQWKGPVGNAADLNYWMRLEDQWFDVHESSRGSGVSRAFEWSMAPSVASHGQNMFVAWEQWPRQPETIKRIYLRAYTGSEWVELGDSAHDYGISGPASMNAEKPIVRVGSDGLPVVAWYQLMPNSDVSRIFVAKWNGTNWTGLANSMATGLTASVRAYNFDMVVDSANRPVVAWSRMSSPWVIETYRWDGSSWSSLGNVSSAQFVDRPRLAAGRNGVLYRTWTRYPNTSAGEFYAQVYAQRYNGGWSAMGTSMTYPGISVATNATMTPDAPCIAEMFNGHVVVAWQGGTNINNAIYVKRFDGVSWQGLYRSDVHPGISHNGGIVSKPALVVDSVGVPYVAFQNEAVYAGGSFSEAMVYSLASDREPPIFTGIRSAVGGTAGEVTLTWLAASDSVSTNLRYHIYRGTQTWACGLVPSCAIDDVFSHRIATVTNVASYTNFGLSTDRIYCFGVRALDERDLEDANTVIRSAGPVQAVGDTDADCLDNVVELDLALNTDPCNPDTDGDGMQDGWEWAFSSHNPLHPIGAFSMDPLDNGFFNVRTGDTGNSRQLPSADPDDDGASSLEEFQWWQAHGATCMPSIANSPSPANPDTDGDGMADGWEIIHGLNPIDPADALGDLDGDNLNNADEFTYGSDPRHVDSDNDGISDGVEVHTYGTLPAKADTDEDGLDDGYEIQIGSDPRNADSNNNTLSDGDMLQLGYANPTAGAPAFNILLSENFETSSHTNWTHKAVNAALPYDLWHLSQAEPAPNTSGIRYLHDRSTTTAYRCAYDPSGTNVTANYNRGMGLRAALESPVVATLAVSNLFVAWTEYYFTEPDADFVQVFVRAGGNPNWFPVSSALSGKSGTEDPASTEPAIWARRVADLSAFVGKTNVQVRFLFVADAVNNDFPGWYVDDVMIYEGVTIQGWVRDINGAPLEGARVMAVGRGGVTNTVDGHAYVDAPTIFGDAYTLEDGSYAIVGLPRGHFYAQATEPGHIGEFYDGKLFTEPYAFGAQLRPGVQDRLQVTQGYMDLTAAGAITNCHFELEPGKGRACLAVLYGGTDTNQSVFLNGLDSNLVARVWSGVANTNLAANAFDVYRALTGASATFNRPDWITNPARPTYLGDMEPGEYMVQLMGSMPDCPLPFVTVREGEAVQVRLQTNQALGRIKITSADGLPYAIWIDGKAAYTQTPSEVGLSEGAHEVALASTNGIIIAPKLVTVPIGSRVVVDFTSNDLYGAVGAVLVKAVDIYGAPVTNAAVFINGEDTGFQTPVQIGSLRPGSHRIAVKKDGYRVSAMRYQNVAAGVTNTAQFVMYDADRDYDWVGDATEIAGYGNVFKYSRMDDPDADGLNNLFEYTQFRLNNIFMNPFNPDTDGDGMLDGAELAYDNVTNTLSISRLETNVIQGASQVRVLFNGQYLAGVDNFGAGSRPVSIEGDRFVAASVSHPLLPMPSKYQAVSVFEGVAPVGREQSVCQGHAKDALTYGDPLPDRVDTDGDGMWDGFEYQFGLSTVAKLDAIENALANVDADFDDLSNYREFLGVDYLANTNDWTDPTAMDSDGDWMPDGWEFFHGLNALDPRDATLDYDGDGLVNLSEFLAGSNPKLPDTDADFLSDYNEVLVYLTDPNNPDTDADGLLDGQEVWDRFLTGTFDGGFFPNWAGGDMDNDGCVDGPTDWDTDGDGMPDGFEVRDAFGNYYNDPRLDPSNPLDADEDPDGDGLSNLQEYLVRDTLFGKNPSGAVWDYSSNPFMADTDGDGMPDGWEVLNGLHPMDPIPIKYVVGDVLLTSSNDCEAGHVTMSDGQYYFRRYAIIGPKGDPDRDGLWNEREYSIRFQLAPGSDAYSSYGESTDPWDADSDNDGLPDGDEDRSLRCSPIVQDSDQDGLVDGAKVAGSWSETESVAWSNDYQLVSGVATTWPAVMLAAAIPHPSNPNIVGHLAVIDTPDEYDHIKSLLTTETNVAIGGMRTYAAEVLVGPLVTPPSTSYVWVTLAPFTFTNWLGGAFPNTTEETTYMVLTNTGEGCLVSTQNVDAYIIEWEDATQVITNHYDQALNDLWQLVWPSAQTLPSWAPVLVDTNSPPPPARWGAAMTYIPVFETKKPKDDNTGVILLDNRQLVVMGGRDGATHRKDIWEYRIRDNMWVQSSSTLFTPGFPYGLSELSAVPLFTYKNTKSKDCPCGNEEPYSCDGEDFGEPKNRPWSTSKSMDWTLIFGGWSGMKDFQGRSQHLFYKSTDDLRPITESLNPDKQVVLVFTPSTTTVSYEYRLPIGYKEENYSGTTNYEKSIIFSGYSAMHFKNVKLRPTCEFVSSALLEITISVPPTNTDINMTIVGELFREEGKSPDSYTTGEESLPDDRVTLAAWFNTTPANFVVPANMLTTLVVDVTAQINELIAVWNWSADQLGFVLYGFDDYAELAKSKTKLTVSYVPSYKTLPVWLATTHSSCENYIPERKSSPIIWDYIAQRMVVFGGIDGCAVLGDTWEGVIGMGDTPKAIVWQKPILFQAPPARWGHSMAFDSKNKRVVLFGGFDAHHRPLNDTWVFWRPEVEITRTNVENGVTNVVTAIETNAAMWSEITEFRNTERPQPRGGASMIFWGDFDYNRGISDYKVGANKQKIVMFGGTDGKRYFNDTWVLDDSCGCAGNNLPRWILVNPDGANSRGPTPRAFAQMVWAQNGQKVPDAPGKTTFHRNGSDDEDDDNSKGAKPAAYLFGGRTGTIPTGPDTDADMVNDGVEHNLGGLAAGRDPRVNRLIQRTHTNETLPFSYLLMGPVPRIGWPIAAQWKTAIADMESLRNDDGVYAADFGLPYEYTAEPDAVSHVIPGQPQVGVDAERPDQFALWYSRYSEEDPFNTKNLWKRGVPNSSVATSSNMIPRYAYSGRWCYGTKLDGSYVNDARMELISPLMNLTIPPVIGTDTNNMNSYFLVFHEWLDLADTNDVVWVDALRPDTDADILARVSGVSKPTLPVLPPRHNAYNTRGEWRRMVVPLDNLANESNVYFRFVLRSDSNKVAGGWYIDDVAVVQGAKLSGAFVGAPGAEVKLYGVNDLETPIQTTTSDGSGMFQFGLLPAGSYMFESEGLLAGPVVLGAGAWVVDAGEQGFLVVSMNTGLPVTIVWPTTPGTTYQIHGTADLSDPAGWVLLDTRTAMGAQETYTDASGSPIRMYRIKIGAP